MRKLFVTEFITLDGVAHAPNEWSFPYWVDGIGDFKLAETMASDALLLGRVTYEGFAAAWPTRTDDAGFADRFNSMPKYVVSTTLTKAEWNNTTIISSNILDEIKKLKQQSGQDIAIHGSVELVRSLMPHNLIDEYRLFVYPLVLGKGKRMFEDGNEAKLNLTESKSFSSGVVLLRYEPVKT
ncbi:MAG TPA: dihydrofolate reductase family protein [Anaerolineales bacterium]|jgi:dihydrofolate reductase|nr:dihydrofolate reductase family protein [Anaerolineales bacterium]